MHDRILAGPFCAALLLLAGCSNPTRPEISTIDASLPFNKAMEAVIKKDRFMAEHLHPGFDLAADGTPESYAVEYGDEGGPVLEQLVVLTNAWCTRNGGRLESLAEMAVLQRGVGVVVQRRENRPVTGQAHNLVCYRGREALGGAALGRASYFLSAAQFRRAMSEAGASIVGMPRR